MSDSGRDEFEGQRERLGENSGLVHDGLAGRSTSNLGTQRVDEGSHLGISMLVCALRFYRALASKFLRKSIL